MTDALHLSFRGSLPATYTVTTAERSVAAVVKALQEEADNIAEEIEQQLRETTGHDAEVEIHFREGSIVWFGQVVWKTVEVLSEIGGAIAFVQLAAPAIDDVLRRRLQPFLSSAVPDLRPETRVTAIPAPGPARRGPSPVPWYRDFSTLLGLGALVIAVAVLFAAMTWWLVPARGGPVESNHLMVLLFAITSALAGGIMYAMFRGEPFNRFEMSRLYFAAGTLAVLSFLFLVAMIFYAVGPHSTGSESPGRVIFEACVKVIPPIVTLIIGFYFGAQQRSGEETASKTVRAAGARRS